MQTFKWQARLGAVLLATSLAMPAVATPVDFEDVISGLDSIYEAGQSFVSGGFKFEVTSANQQASPGDLYGQVGDVSSLFVLAPPTNPTGQFFQSYNDGGVTMTSAVAGASFFSLMSFDFSFLAFADGFYGEGDVPGALVASYITSSGAAGLETFAFGAAEDGGFFAFDTVGGPALGSLSGAVLRSVTFFACTPGVNFPSDCFSPSEFNDAWFALDNIRVSAIPEPGSLAIIALAFAAAGIVRRRQAA